MNKTSCVTLIAAIAIAMTSFAGEVDKHAKTENGIEAATRAYIKTHGLKDFTEEYYNLLGTKPKASVSEKNKELAIALGLGEFVKDLPVEVPRAKVREAVGIERFKADRKVLSAFFRDQPDTDLVQRAQQQMLEWHFAAADNYGTALTNAARQVRVGWNLGAEVKGTEDFSAYTFGLVGCTALAAVAEDGSFHMSHWDGVVNSAQVKLFDEFEKQRPGSEVFVVGHHARALGAALTKRYPKLSIYVHTKEKYLKTNYTVCFAREKGKLKVTHANTPLAAGYIPSIHNGGYGPWFAHGRFGEILPPEDKSFVQTTFQELEKYKGGGAW